jgi:hypothetical protein
LLLIFDVCNYLFIYIVFFPLSESKLWFKTLESDKELCPKKKHCTTSSDITGFFERYLTKEFAAIAQRYPCWLFTNPEFKFGWARKLKHFKFRDKPAVRKKKRIERKGSVTKTWDTHIFNFLWVWTFNNICRTVVPKLFWFMAHWTKRKNLAAHFVRKNSFAAH